MPNMMQERNSARAKVCALKVECNKLRAEIEMWRDECREWQSHTRQLRPKLANAKVEIERLRKQRDEWAEKAVAQANAGRLFVVPNQEFQANADLGELVRGMQGGTGLKHYSGGTWYAMRYCRDVGWCTIRVDLGTHDPAEALRAIQEVGDAEMS